VLFEKYNKKKEPVSPELIGAFLVLSIVVSYMTYGACIISGVLNVDGKPSSITVLDLINGLAQIATALAFLLAFQQYKKSSKQQRQTELATEAKAQIVKIVGAVENIKTGDDTCLNNLDESLSRLSNLGTNFNEIFKSMDEDIQKAIVRMHWQDMFFNDLSPVLSKLCPKGAIKSAGIIDEIQLTLIVFRANHKIKSFKMNKEFHFAKELFNDRSVVGEINLKEKLNALDMFVARYLNDHNLNDQMYGLISRIDIMAKAPLLAVAGPSEWATRDESSSNT